MVRTRFEPKRILTALAEGALSDHALEVSVDLANRLDASLELLHAVAVPGLLGTRFDSSQVAAWNSERVGQARDSLLAHLARVHPDAEVGGEPVSELVHVVAGAPSKVLLDRAGELDADLLVIGASGKTKNLDLGGVARALLSGAPCPLWMQTTPPTEIRRVLAPIDLSDHSLASLGVAVDLAQKLSAEITALHCLAVEDYAYLAVPYGAAAGGAIAGVPAVGELLDAHRAQFEERMDAFGWDGVPHRTVFSENDPARAILEAAGEYDLVVMGTHGRTGLSAALLGGVAYRVMRSIQRPVLAIRQADRHWVL